MTTEEKVSQLRIGDVYRWHDRGFRMRIGENKWIFLSNEPDLNGCTSGFTDRDMMSMSGMEKVNVEYKFTPVKELKVGDIYKDPWNGNQRIYIGNDEWICLDGPARGRRSHTCKTEEILKEHAKVN